MLTLTYVILAAVGCGVVALTIALGTVFDGDGLFGHDGGIDAGFHFPFLSPTALAALRGRALVIEASDTPEESCS